MKKPILSLAISALSYAFSFAQPCTPLGDQTSYGTNDTWIGYVYDNMNFTGYAGYVTEGSPGNPQFNQSFGGGDVNYPTNGCSVFTSTFSVRYKLRKTFTAGAYEITVGADDGYRISVDGGSTWIIDRWFDQGYNTTSVPVTLSGSTDLVLEYYENGGGNQVSFSIATSCSGSEDPSVYGTSDQWRGYVYDGTNFNAYKGLVTEGTLGNISIDQSFGGGNTMYPTSACSVQTETYSVRYRLRKGLPAGNYTFIVGGDDGYRFSLDGGSTWIIDQWWDQSYNSTSQTVNLPGGNYNMVLEFYENGGDNRITFQMQANVILPIRLLSFKAQATNVSVKLAWDISTDSDPSFFIIERGADGISFNPIHRTEASEGARNNAALSFHWIDNTPLSGKSYYRLRITELNGAITYSPVLVVHDQLTAGSGIRLFPTVLEKPVVYLRSDREVRQAIVRVTDMTGQVVYTRSLGNISANQTTGIELRERQLPPGTYIVSLAGNGKPLFNSRVLIPR